MWGVPRFFLFCGNFLKNSIPFGKCFRFVLRTVEDASPYKEKHGRLHKPCRDRRPRRSIGKTCFLSLGGVLVFGCAAGASLRPTNIQNTAADFP